ncbi:outer membrane beta-barrel protein [Candidatus Fermentibacteria bacterium]|nr:outer membrane beta-barrel protein [Candidatus Fermentibacteria bacterium]
MRHGGLLTTLLLFCVMPALVFAGTTGKVAGMVSDASTGKPLAYVNIMIEGTTLGQATDETGEFNIIGVPAGSWSVRASMIGYADQVEQSVPVSVDLTTKVDFALSPKALVVGDEIVVVAERRLIRPDETQSMRTTSREDLAILPVTTMQDVLTKSTSTAGTGNNLHVRGGRAGEATVLVDGMTISEPQYRTNNLEVGREALAEMQMLTGGFNAEYGDAQSGIIIVTTREGTPESYSGKIMYQTDDIADNGLTPASTNYDYMEFSIGGPEPITSKLLPQLGVKIPGNLTMFLQGDVTFTDRQAFHQDAFDSSAIRLSSEQWRWWNDHNSSAPNLEPAISRELGTSDQFRSANILDDLFGVGKRERNWQNGNIKLSYSPSPTYNLAFSSRWSNKDRNFWHASQGNDLRKMIPMAQALGIDDGIDNDGDGLIDEEVFNGIDDDGDGYVDELDGTLIDPATYLGGSLGGMDLSWGVDRDGDDRIDEEAWNGIDDDGDGLIDEDLQPDIFQGQYYNGWDFMFTQKNEDNQQLLTWKHVVGRSTFYEVKLSRLRNMQAWMPKRGQDGESASDIDEIRGWLDDYEAYRVAYAEYLRLLDAGDTTAVRPTSPDPYLGMGYVQEPYTDTNGNYRYDLGEPFEDLDGDGMWDFFNASGANRTLWFSGQNHPFRGLCYYGVSGYTTGDDPSFYRSGVNYRESKTWTLKADVTSQIARNHMLKAGIEGKTYDLQNWSRQLLAGDNGEGLFGNDYHFKPQAAAAYVQDKMEYQSAIVNMGLRFDYFSQGDNVDPLPLDAGSSIARRGEETPEPSFSLLPRFGISFPVTERDVFHFFYGHFFQQPLLFNVFNKVNQAISSSNDIIGNPYLEPEKTISYEFGIKHQFGINSLATVTAFFKDVDNLVQIDRIFEGAPTNMVYHTYVNSTYGTVRGFEVTASQRDLYNFSGEVSYTYQIATTTHSTSYDTYTGYEQFQLLPGKEYPADWDRRHSVTFNLSYGLGSGEGPSIGGIKPFSDLSVSVLGEIGSGLPYTPTSSNDSPLYELTNENRLPWTHEWDLRLLKKLTLGKVRWGIQMDMYNVFDSMNVVSIDDGGAVDQYRDRIGYTNSSGATSLRNYGGFENSIALPTAWDSGRRIRLGVSVEF